MTKEGITPILPLEALVSTLCQRTCGKPPKTPKRCPGGQPAPHCPAGVCSQTLRGAQRQPSCSREGKHNYAHSALCPLWFGQNACCADGENRFAILALSKRATCSPFPMAQCVRTNRPHAEICSIEGLFSTRSRSTFQPTHGKTPTSTTLRRCCALTRWRSIRPTFARATVRQDYFGD